MIVVTGATGNVGRPLVQALAVAGALVTAGSGQGAGAPAGVRTLQADLTEPKSLEPALAGAEALFLLTPPALLLGGAIGDVVVVTREAGIRRVVLLSSQGVGTGRHPSSLEDAVTRSGLEWTVLRPGNFDSNALQWAGTVRERREVVAPFGDVALPAIDPADIAEVAAVVLRGRGHEGGVYTLTGPAPISPRQQAAAIGDVLGEPVRYVEQTREQARDQMLGFMPEPVVAATLGVLGTPSQEEQRVNPDVERLLGRAPRAFADWAARNAAAFG